MAEAGHRSRVSSQPLRSGDTQKLVVYPSTSPYLAQVKVLGREKLKAAGKNYSAIKADLKLWRIDDDDLELKQHTKFKRATVWLSDDSDRLLLRIEADIMVGSFYDPELDEGCAFEELISFHGGIGGPQTQPFILHPNRLQIPDEPIIGAAKVHAVLAGWRADLDGES